jgi:hypothetical protein
MFNRRKKVCIIFGNCVAGEQFSILRKVREFSKSFKTFFQLSFKHPQDGEQGINGDLIKQCSLLLIQRGHLQFPEFYNDCPKECQVISFPLPSLTSFWPFYRKDPRNKPEPERGYIFGRYPYGDLAIIRLIKKSLPPEEIYIKYMAMNVKDQIDLNKLHRTNILKGKELDEKCDLALYDFIEKNAFKQRLFFTPNHPTPILLIYQINQVLKQLGMGKLSNWLVSKISRRSEFSRMHLPIHPQVIDHFRIEWANRDTTYRYFNKGWLSFEEYYKRYIEFC